MISVCIFGSQARRTADALSDRDVLLIGSPSTLLNQIIARWTADAWNVSVFDRAGFARMADVRSLFIQHLKQEGNILCDEGAFLASTMERYTPKADYLPERNDALTQIIRLPTAMQAYWPNLCLADIIYVLFRNAAILHLASSREYCFQYNTLIGRIADLFALSGREKGYLLALRNLKHAYRRRETGLPVECLLGNAREVIETIVMRLPSLLPSSIEEGDTTDEYYRLRLSELDLVSQTEPLRLDALMPTDSLFAAWKQIRGAGGYPKPRVNLN